MRYKFKIFSAKVQIVAGFDEAEEFWETCRNPVFAVIKLLSRRISFF
jgi:hypothetical protein